jgi:uncharacterized protein
VNDSEKAKLLGEQTMALLACPVCFGALKAGVESIACTECKRVYPVVDGIPVLIAERAG